MKENVKRSRLFDNKYMAMQSCRHGFMLYNLNDRFIGKSLDQYGEWCEGELELLGQIIKEGDVVLDIGANIGTHTVYFAKQVAEKGFVFAFEPQRLAYQNLCANVTLNELLNVKCIKAGVGNEKGQIKIPIFNPNVEMNFGAICIENFEEGEIVELVVTDEMNLNRCNLIKIDVEGMECKVLEGAKKTVNRLKPYLFVENNTEERSGEIIEKLYSFDYECYWHFCPYYNPNNFFDNSENIFSRYQPEVNMLCVHKSVNINGLTKVSGVEDNWVKALRSILNKNRQTVEPKTVG